MMIADPQNVSTNDGCFAELPGFSDFRGFTDPDNYRPVPDDWSLVYTDVVSSTLAVAGGQYKDVNMISVASIVCAQRVVGDLKFPFIFGGDGATLLIPRRFQEGVLAALLGLRNVAQSGLGLDVRVGAVNIGELAAEGYPIRMAKHQLCPAQNIAIMEGAGLEEAERRIRAHPETYQHGVLPEEHTDLSGLSCRWRPVPSQRGRVVSLIIQARSRRGGLYQEILDSLDEVIDSLDTANPIGAPWMSYRSILECIRDERRLYQGYSREWFKRVLEIILAVALFKYRFPGIGFSLRDYKNQLRTHSDFRKYDNVLKMTLDCSPAEIRAIRGLCNSYYEAGEIYYGLHENDSALITCFLNGLGEGEHLHFVDATDGGYTTAASQLKRQMERENIVE